VSRARRKRRMKEGDLAFRLFRIKKTTTHKHNRDRRQIAQERNEVGTTSLDKKNDVYTGKHSKR
jgi:hypothetical protein